MATFFTHTKPTPKRTLHAILAVNDKGVIGDNNGLPWHDPTDLTYFREFVANKTLVVGRKTYESLPDSVKDIAEKFVILTHDRKFKSQFWGDEIIRFYVSGCIGEEFPEAVVIGGKQIYELLAHEIKYWHITRITDGSEGDTKLDINKLLGL